MKVEIDSQEVYPDYFLKENPAPAAGTIIIDIDPRIFAYYKQVKESYKSLQQFLGMLSDEAIKEKVNVDVSPSSPPSNLAT